MSVQIREGELVGSLLRGWEAAGVHLHVGSFFRLKLGERFVLGQIELAAGGIYVFRTWVEKLVVILQPKAIAQITIRD